MKIAFLSRYQGKIHRGAENFVSEITGRLSKKHEVEILAGKEADSLKKVLEGRFDIVVPVNGRFQAIKVSWGRFLGNYKVLITGHSGKGWDDILNILAKPDIFVGLTEYLADWAKKWAWGSKVVKIHNGIDLNKFNPAGEKTDLNLKKPIILSAGALAWYKRHEKIIDAMTRLNDCSLLIAGEGPLKELLEKKGRRLLGDRFQITSFNYEEMPKIYRSCDLFTLPSWDREAFGLVYLEAMASGLSVVAPDDPPRREIIGEAGVFVDVDNSEKYAKAINAALKKDWAEKPRQQAEKFSWDKIAAEYEKLILGIVNLK